MLIDIAIILLSIACLIFAIQIEKNDKAHKEIKKELEDIKQELERLKAFKE